jgi:hypothetical protein
VIRSIYSGLFVGNPSPFAHLGAKEVYQLVSGVGLEV